MDKISFKLNKQLNAYRHFANEFAFASCRLVHYVGNDRPNAMDVQPHDVENEIAGCLAEGFYVDWLCVDDKLYLCVQEPDCPIPPWERVITEEELIDVESILKQAGFFDRTQPKL